MNTIESSLSKEELSLRTGLIKEINYLAHELGLKDRDIDDVLLMLSAVVISEVHEGGFAHIFINGHEERYFDYERKYHDYDLLELLSRSLNQSCVSNDYKEWLIELLPRPIDDYESMNRLFNAVIRLIKNRDIAPEPDPRDSVRLFKDLVDFFLSSTLGVGARSSRLPRKLAKCLVEAAEIHSGQFIFDPYMREGEIFEVISQSPAGGKLKAYVGWVTGKRDYLVSATRELLSGKEAVSVEPRPLMGAPRALSQDYDVAFCVPPLGMKRRVLPSDDSLDAHFQTSDATGLFVSQALKNLKPDGRAVLLLSFGVLSSSNKNDLDFRKWLLANLCIEKVIAMPVGALADTGIPTAIVVLRNSKPAFPIRYVSLSDQQTFFKKDYEARDFFEHASANILDSLELDENCIWEMHLEDFSPHLDLSPVNRTNIELDRLINELRDRDDYEIRSLAECCQVISGLQIQSSDLLERSEDGEAFTNGYVRIGDIQNRRIKHSEKVIDFERISFQQKLTAFIKNGRALIDGDVLISVAGTIGKAGLVDEFSGGDIFSQGLIALRPNKTISSDYLVAYLESAPVQEWMNIHATGATIKRLSKDSLSSLPIVVPNADRLADIRVLGDSRGRLIDVPKVEFWSLYDGIVCDFSGILVSEWIGELDKIESDTDLLELAEQLGAVLRSILSAEESRFKGLSSEQWSDSWVSLLQSKTNDINSIVLSKDLDSSDSFKVDYLICVNYLNSLNLIEEKAPDNMLYKLFFKTLEDRVCWLMTEFYLAQGLLFKATLNSDSQTIGLVVNNPTGFVFSDVRINLHLFSKNGKTEYSRLVSGQSDHREFFEFSKLENGAQVDLVVGKGFEHKGLPLDHYGLKIDWMAEGENGEYLEQNFLVIDLEEPRRKKKLVLSGSPYICGDPVRPENSDLFFGREELLGSIKRQISNKGNVVLLEGNRRAGKTSILSQLEGLGQVDGWLAVYFSLQGVEGNDQGYGVPTERIFQEMAASIAKSLLKNGLDGLLPNGEVAIKKLGISRVCREAISNDQPFSDFVEYLEVVLEYLEEKQVRLVLMMDEFDKVQEGIDSGVTSPQVPENIRYLVQSYPRFTAILTGSRRLKRLREEYWSALFGLGTRIGVTSLSPEDSKALVTKPVEGLLEYSQVALKNVITNCARQPFLIQSLCNRIYDDCARENKTNVGLDVVERSLDAFMQDNEHFSSLWGYAESDIRRFILAIIAVNGDLAFGELHQKLDGYSVGIREEELINDIDFLIELELIKKDLANRYSLEVPMMQIWINKHKDVEALRIRASYESGDISDE